MAKIQSVTAFTTQKDSEREGFKSLYKEFNLHGDLILENRYNEDGDVIARTANSYNDNGLIIETIFYDAEQDTSETHKYLYDDNGSLVKETLDFGQGFLTVYVYSRDNEKRQVTISEQDEEGEVEEIRIQMFDVNGNLLEETVFNDENKPISNTKNTFDQDQRLIRKEESDLRYKTIQSHEYYYNESGRVTGIKTLNQKGRLLNWVKVEFDELNRPVRQTTMGGALISIEHIEANRRIEKHLDAGGGIVFETEVELNNEGNVVAEHSPDAVVRYEYEYFPD